jgi:hypothetical protein
MGSGRPLRFAGIELHQLTKARIGFVRNPPGIGTFKVRDGGCFVIEILKNFPDNVVAISCSGQVTKEDYDRILVPAILKALKRHEKIGFLYKTSANFTGYDPGALWEDLKIGVEHPTRWERLAVVTDVDWIVHTMKLLSFLIPCPTKLFSLSQEAQANAWIIAAS